MFKTFFCRFYYICFFSIGAETHLESTGIKISSPHCSYFSKCLYDDATLRKCAIALCSANGYYGVSFAKASNNFCNSSYTEKRGYSYLVDTDDVVWQVGLHHKNEGKIAANCTIPGNNIMVPDL